MKVIVKKPNEPAEFVDVEFKYRGECASLISNEGITTEFVGIADGFAMMVDEDGLPKQLPFNFFINTNSLFFPVQVIVGTVVFCRFQWEDAWQKELWDYELRDATEDDMAAVERMMDGRLQEDLKWRYLRRER